MPLTFEIEVPKMKLVVTNRRALIEMMAQRVAKRVRDRAERGLGDTSGLPAPKDGGRSYNRTGQLVKSIGYVMRQLRRSGEDYAIVQPLGDRGEHQERRAKLAAAIAIGRALQGAAGQDVRAIDRQHREQLRVARALGRGLAKLGRRSGVHHRTRRVTTNMSLAMILQNPPRDARGIAGQRGLYKVFTPRQIEIGEMRALAELQAEVEIVQTGAVIRRL